MGATVVTQLQRIFAIHCNYTEDGMIEILKALSLR